MKKFRAAIIGLGKIGFTLDAAIAEKYVISYARAFSLHGGFDLVSGFDIDERRLSDFKEKYKVPAYHYKELEKYLKDVDAVVIAVPIKDHFKVFKRVASCCSPRLLVMEKPLAANLGQAREITEIAEKKGFLFYVNYFRRVDPGIAKLRQGIKQKKWGSLKHINIYYGQGLLNNGSHFIDLMLYLFGSPDDIKLLRKYGKEDSDFVFYYKQFSVYFKSSLGIDYNLKEMDFIFERARVRYSSLPETELMLPKKRSCFGTKELISCEDKNLHLDLERYMFNVVGHIYDLLNGKSKPVSTAWTALEALEDCYGIMKKEAAR